MLFVKKVRAFKVSDKFVKSVREKVYSIGFPASEVLNGNLSFESISEKIGAKSFEVKNELVPSPPLLNTAPMKCLQQLRLFAV